MAYCDTNVLTTFINVNQLNESLGHSGFKRFKNNIKGKRRERIEEAFKKNKCVVSREPLLDDIGDHRESVGAILTNNGLGKIEIKNVKGFEKGKKVYNEACSKVDKQTGFYKKFCEDRKLKKVLVRNDANDIKHFGSAIKLGEKTFLTDNQKDFKLLEEFSNIKIEGGYRKV